MTLKRIGSLYPLVPAKAGTQMDSRFRGNERSKS